MQTDEVLEMLQARIEGSPDHSDSWRLLGQYYVNADQLELAEEKLARSLELDPANSAGHFNMAELQRRLKNEDVAEYHFRKVLEIAPDSAYAEKTRALGFELKDEPTSNDSTVNESQLNESQLNESPLNESSNSRSSHQDVPQSNVLPSESERLYNNTEPVGPSVEPTFEHAQKDARNQSDESRFDAGIEIGALFNSNVSLTPISRELAQANNGGAQIILNPNVQYDTWKTASGWIGISGNGYFAWNEGSNDQFDFASFQPGVYWQTDRDWNGQELSIRTQYGYSIDRFGGATIGDRHTLTLTGTLHREDKKIDLVYGSIAQTDFRIDGLVPLVNSLDGTTYVVGASRFYLTGDKKIPLWSWGVSGETNRTEGADFRYEALLLQSNVTVNLNPEWSAVPSFALGQRWYGDFTGSPSRDEFNWRGGVEFQRQFNRQLTMVIVANTDQFLSDNANFEIERYRVGVVFRWQD